MFAFRFPNFLRVVLFLLVGGFAYLGWGIKSDSKTEARVQKRLKAGMSLVGNDVAKVYARQGCRISAGICLVAACLITRRREPAPLEPTHAPEQGISMPERYLMGLALLVLGIAPALRMDHSAWSDEQEFVGDYVVGEIHPRPDGTPSEFKAVEWPQTLFGYYTPNNHVLYAILAKSCHALHQQGAGKDDAAFNMVLLRLPAFFAGLLTLYFLWEWARGHFGRPTAWVSVILLGLHPWWVRYTSEARGYTLVMLFAVLLLRQVTHCLRISQPNFKSYVLLGLLEFLLLWTWPLGVHMVFWLNISLVTYLLISAPRRAHLRPWLVGQLLAASFAVPLLLGHVDQVRRYLSVMGNQLADALSPRDLIADLLTGRRLVSHKYSLDHFHPTWEGNPLGSSWIILLMAGITVGAVQLWRHHPHLRWCLAPLLLAPVEMVTSARIFKTISHAWYLGFALPGLLVLMAYGLSVALCQLPKNRRSLAASTALLAWAGGMAWPMRIQVGHPLEYARESAALIGAPRNPFWKPLASDPIYAVKPAHQIYLPSARRAESAGSLLSIGQEADATGRDFFFYENAAGLAHISGSELGKILADTTKFKRLSLMHGSESDRPVATYQWIPQSTPPKSDR